MRSISSHQFKDVKIRINRLDSQMENYQTFEARGEPVDLHSGGRELVISNRKLSGLQSSQNGQSVARPNHTPARDWSDEMLSFSATLSRQSQFTLHRIKNHFKQTGTKFDADFRNHFLYVANNR